MATASRSTAELNSLYTSTMEEWMGGGTVEETAFEANQLIWLLSRVSKEVGEYGFEMVQPLMTTKNNGVGWFEYDDSLNTSSYQGPEAAKFDMSFLGGPLVITEQEEIENGPTHRRVNLLRFKADQLLLSMAEEVNIKGFEGNTTNSKAINGLEDILYAGTNTTGEGDFSRTQATGGITNTYGGITRTGSTGWENYSVDLGGYTDDFDNGDNFAGDKYKAVEQMYILCSRGAIRPDIILSSLEPYTHIHRLMANVADYRREVDTFKGITLGFDNTKFRSAVWFYDEAATTYNTAGGNATAGSHNIYMLNTAFMKMCVESGYDFAMTDFDTPTDVRVSIAHLLWRGQLLSTNPRYLGRLFDY